MKNDLVINLKNKIILITGGYGHLGKGIVNSLLAHDAEVYVLGRSIEKFKEAFDSDHIESLFFQHCDISDAESINNAIGVIFSRKNRIDAFINNAYYLKGNSPEDMTDNDFIYSIEGTLTACFKSIKTLIPIMKKQGYGKIINVSSMYGVVAPDFSVYDDSPQFFNPPHYGAAKAGLVQLTKYYASYLGKYNINVNAVSPGPFPHDSVQKDVGFIKKLESKTALKRIGQPSDLGGIFVFLCSDASNYITGQNLMVDGGWTSL